MFVDHFDSYKFASLLEGYGEHNLEEINFYVFVLLLWLMSAHIKSGKFRGRLRRFEKVLKHILDEIN